MPLTPRKHTCIREPVVVTSMSLSAKNHCCKLLKGLQQLRKDETLCDYSLIAEGQVFRVHRVVMAAISDYFHVMLTGEMRESRQGSVDLKGVTAAGLQVIIEFAYTGNLELTVDNIEEILSAATHLQVSDAIDLCCKYLEKSVNLDNCVDVLNLAELYTLKITHKIVRSFILDNFESVAETEHYFRLTSTQLLSLLQENSLRVISEYRLFRLVLNWMNDNFNDRKDCIVDLMRSVRLPLLSGEEIVEKVSQVNIMKSDPECQKLLDEAKDYHIIVGKQPLFQTSRTQVRSDRNSLVLSHAENLESFCFESKRHGFLKDAVVPLYNPCVCVIDNFMYACGGKYDSNENSEIATARCFRYDPRFDSWHEIAPMNEARKDFTMVADCGKLYAIGGQDENMVMCTVECFHIDKNEWELKSSMNHSVYGHASALWHNKIFASGGQRFTGSSKNLVCYSIQSDCWEEKKPMLNSRMNHVMCCVNDKLYVLGGNIEDSYGFPVPVIGIEQYCPLTNQWSSMEKRLNIRESGACALKNIIYITGGINGEHYYSDLVQAYDPKKEELKIVERFPTRIYGRACCILTLPQYMS